MLDVTLRGVSCVPRLGAMAPLRDANIVFCRGLHTAVAGDTASGASTLLAMVSGALQPSAGEVAIGARPVNGLKQAKRPLLVVGPESDAPLRWSAAHALIAAARGRTLDREDREREIAFVASKWEVDGLMTRAIRDLPIDDRLRVHLAAIELSRPAILVADRLFEHASGSLMPQFSADLHRALRIAGTTMIYTPSGAHDLAECDDLVVLERGAIVQQGSLAAVYRAPVSEAAARATGEISVIPLVVRGSVVESSIGSWSFDGFEGNGVALCRPEHFSQALPGEESDLILAIEEARFRDGRWFVIGNLSGAVPLTVVLPGSEKMTRGRLLPLRYDPTSFMVLPGGGGLPHGSTVSTDVIPARDLSR